MQSHQLYSPETSLTDALSCWITAAGANPKKQSANSSSVNKSATAEYQPWDDVDVFEVPHELRRPNKDGEQHNEMQTPLMVSLHLLISNPSSHPTLRRSCERARQVLRTRRAVPENIRSSNSFQLQCGFQNWHTKGNARRLFHRGSGHRQQG